MAMIGYARVSTEDQHPEAQLDALEEAGCERIFTDRGVSGKLARRPQWDKCLDHLRAGDTLVVLKLDRAGRSVKHLIELVEHLRGRQIDLRILNQQLDTSSPGGRLFFHLISAFAEFEADLISERTKDGLAAARARGRVGGRPMKLSPRQQAEVRRLHADGRPIVDIAELFSVSRPVIYRILEAAQPAA